MLRVAFRGLARGQSVKDGDVLVEPSGLDRDRNVEVARAQVKYAEAPLHVAAPPVAFLAKDAENEHAARTATWRRRHVGTGALALDLRHARVRREPLAEVSALSALDVRR
jgi:hypothetical protein